MIKYVLVGIVGLISGCAHLEFEGGDGLSYYESVPYLFVSTTAECVTTATVITIPGERKKVELISGYGAAELAVSLNNGMITSVGQKTDTKAPDTITSIAALTTAVGALRVPKAEEKPQGCKPTAILYHIKDGTPNENDPISFPVSK